MGWLLSILPGQASVYCEPLPHPRGHLNPVLRLRSKRMDLRYCTDKRVTVNQMDELLSPGGHMWWAARHCAAVMQAPCDACSDIIEAGAPGACRSSPVQAAQRLKEQIPHLLQAILVVGKADAVLERASQHIELLGVGVTLVPAQVACARYRMDTIHTCDQTSMRELREQHKQDGTS